jgi:hypothetical protein
VRALAPSSSVLLDALARPLLLIEVMDQFNPTRWQRFVRDVVNLRAQYLADAMQ